MIAAIQLVSWDLQILYDCYGNVLHTDMFSYWRFLSLCCLFVVRVVYENSGHYHTVNGSLISSLPAVQIMRHAGHVGNIISLIM